MQYYRDRSITGFRFRIYSMQWKLFLYAARAFEVYVDGNIIDNSKITIEWNGKIYPAELIAGSDCMVAEGEIITINVDYPGGMDSDHQHEIFIRFKSGGDYGKDGTGTWINLADFKVEGFKIKQANF